MKYALLLYGSPASEEGDTRRLSEVAPEIAEVLHKPAVSDWIRLHGTNSATTVSRGEGRTLLTDGPFIDSKEILGGLVIVEADDLDGALAVADELLDTRPRVIVEVRPVLETA